MKVRCEYQKAISGKSFLWKFIFSKGPFGGEYGDFSTFESQRKVFDSAFKDFSRHIEKTYRRKVLGFTVLQRSTVAQPVAVGQFIVSDTPAAGGCK